MNAAQPNLSPAAEAVLLVLSDERRHNNDLLDVRYLAHKSQTTETECWNAVRELESHGLLP
jgi:hypothetical protein